MSKKPDAASRMAEILSANRFSELAAEEAPSPAPIDAPALRSARPEAKPAIQSDAPPRRGRPLGSKSAKAGKKSDEEFCPTTIYIRKDTRKRVKQALLDAESSEDVSDLVEGLLQQWLRSRH